VSGILGFLGDTGGFLKSTGMAGSLWIRCRRAPALHVTVNDANGNGVAGARVVATENGGWSRTGWTDANGVKEFIVYAGTYTVTAAKDWYLPQPQTSAGNVVNAGTVNVVLAIAELRYYLCADTNRDGVVENTWTNDPQWTWGVNGSGAVMLCNCDDDSGNNASDNANNQIDGVADEPDIAPLDIVRVGSVLEPPANWTAELSVGVGAEANIRIFGGIHNGDAEVIPSVGLAANAHAVTLHLGDGAGLPTTHLGMEARRFAGAGWTNGIVTIWLTLTKPGVEGGNVTYRTGVKVRVAPWLMPDHLEEEDTHYVISLGADVLGVNNVIVGGNSNFRGLLQQEILAAGPAYLAIPGGGSRWAQDVMEFGFSVLPGAPHHRIEVIMQGKDNGGIAAFMTGLRGADFGHITAHTGGGFPANFDGLGNLEVTPPVRDSDNNEYQWGRIFFGPGDATNNDLMDAGTQAFLKAQVVQAPIEIDTAWLLVGHVDEVMSFLPCPTRPAFKQWKLLVPSPTRAYQILGQQAGTLRLLRNRRLRMWDFNNPGIRNYMPVEQTLNAFLNGNTNVVDPDLALAGNAGTITGPVLQQWNEQLVQARIDGIVNNLQDEIDLTPNDIIHVPVIFYPFLQNWNPNSQNPDHLPPHSVAALTADMVNLLVTRDRVVVPKPYGPKPNAGADYFERDFTQDIQQANNALGIVYIDDWYTYHDLDGEIHCGTNTLRRPANMGAWAATRWARWWEFEPPD
jgi:protein-arginine deiminase